MSSIYVRTTGNDTTGTGLTGAPYLTLKKAISIAVDGDYIFMGDGTYIEDSGSGYLLINKTFATLGITIAPESGLPDKVVITGAVASVYGVIITGGAQRITFDQITFRAASTDCQRIIRWQGSASNEIEFRRCRFQAWSTSSTQNGCVGSSFSSGNISSGMCFVSCSFEQIGPHDSFGVTILPSAGATISNIQIRDCRFILGYSGVRIANVTVVQIHDNTISQTNPTSSVHPLTLGVDGDTGDPTTGSVIGNRVRAAGGHAAVIGAGCNGVYVFGNQFYGGKQTSNGQGLVIKECSNVRVERNTIYSGLNSGLYFKAAKDCQAFDNIVYNEYATSPALQVNRNSANSHTSERLVVRRNLFVASAGQVISWAPAGAIDDAGGSYCDENVYAYTGTASLGNIQGTAVTTLSGLRAAWSNYDRPVNDRNSRIGQTQATFAGTPIVDLPS